MFTYNNALDQFVFEDEPNNGGGNTNDNTNTNDNGGNGGKKDPPWKSEFGDTFDPDKAWEALQASRRAERTAKNGLNTAEKRLKEIDDADKSELTKAQERLAEMEKTLEGYAKKEREATQRVTVAEAARKHGAVNADDIYALVASQLEVDSDGKVTNAEKVVADFKKSRPAYFAVVKQGVNARTQGDGDNKDGKTSDFNTGIRALFGR